MAVTRREESESGGESKPYLSVAEGEAGVATDQLGNINQLRTTKFVDAVLC
jgi:hypothetical protein